MALKYHPDKYKDEKVPGEKFKEIKMAYEFLSNEHKYDEKETAIIFLIKIYLKVL